MFASINAFDIVDDNSDLPSKGKTPVVEASQLDFKIVPKFDIFGQPAQPSQLEIQASCTVVKSDGSKGGTRKETIRTLTLRLNPDDLQQIFHHAIQAGLLPSLPGNELSNATEHLRQALQILSKIESEGLKPKT